METEYLNGESGGVKIADEVIATIAAVAAKEVEGVTAIAAKSPVEVNVKGIKINAKSMHRGIRVEETDRGLAITLGIVVRYGCKLPEVAEKVQDNIFHSVETMTGIAAASITVNVVGVSPDGNAE